MFSTERHTRTPFLSLLLLLSIFSTPIHSGMVTCSSANTASGVLKDTSYDQIQPVIDSFCASIQGWKANNGPLTKSITALNNQLALSFTLSDNQVASHCPQAFEDILNHCQDGWLDWCEYESGEWVSNTKGDETYSLSIWGNFDADGLWVWEAGLDGGNPTACNSNPTYSFDLGGYYPSKS